MAPRPAGPRRQTPWASCLPWTDGSGRPWPGWRRLPLVTPAVIAYVVLSWSMFVQAAARTPGTYSIDQGRIRPYVYAIPDLSRDLPRALRSLATGPFLNHNAVQLVYVTLLLVLFGLVFEAKEGTPRAVGFFFATSFVAAVGAGVLLHLIYPELIDNAFLARAWERTWSGGSAGCFGLMGALAARARRPWPLLGLFVLWELNVVYWYLNEYTPAFHLSALLAGFVIARYGVPPIRPETTRERRSATANRAPAGPPHGPHLAAAAGNVVTPFGRVTIPSPARRPERGCGEAGHVRRVPGGRVLHVVHPLPEVE